MRHIPMLAVALMVCGSSSCSRDPVVQATNDQRGARPEEPQRVESRELRDEAAMVEEWWAVNVPQIAEIEPTEWVKLHHAALRPQSADWKDAIESLQRVGDGFTFEHLERLKTDELGESEHELLQAALATIAERFASEDEPTSAALVLPRLERAAHADLMCDPLETKLVAWTLRTIRQQVQQPPVRARLEELARNYKPADETETLFSSMSERVPAYAAQLLKQATRSEATGPN